MVPIPNFSNSYARFLIVCTVITDDSSLLLIPEVVVGVSDAIGDKKYLTVYWWTRH